MNMNFSKVGLIALGMNFLFLASHGLDQNYAKRVLYWLDEEKAGDSTGGSAITFDGKYKNRNQTYEAVKNISDGKEATIKEFSLEGPDLESMKKIFGSTNSPKDKNIEVIDVSYESLKNYYDSKYKGKHVTFNFRDDDQEEASLFLKKIKDFFDTDNPEQSDFEELAKKFIVNCENDDFPKGFKNIMDNVINIMIKSEVGSRRIKSLLLQILLSRIEKEGRLSIRLDLVNYFFKGNFGSCWDNSVDPMALKSLLLNFKVDYSDSSKATNFENMFSALEDALYPDKVRRGTENLNGVSSGNTDDLLRAYDFMAVGIIHELTHSYHQTLPLLCSKFRSESATVAFKKACLKNTTLAKEIIPLLDPVLRCKIKERAKTDPDIQTFLKNNAQWVEKNLKAIKEQTGTQIDELDMLIDRDIARELSVLDNPEEVMTMNGGFFFSLENGKLIYFKDAENEAAANKEFGFPIRYGHTVTRLDDKKTKEEYKSENCELNYYPFKLTPTVINGGDRMIEPIILQNVAIKRPKSYTK